MLRGNLEKATHRTISGWVQDTTRPNEAVGLIMTDNDKFIRRVIADRYREDLQLASIGDGHHFFEVELPQPLSPSERHVIRVFDESDGIDLPGSPMTLESSQPRATLRGSLDSASFLLVSGWVQDADRPEEPIGLIITSNDQLVERVLANRYREDLKNAGIGSGRHAFEAVFSNSLSPLERHVVRVISEADGTDIPGSPITIEPAGVLGEREAELIAGVLSRLQTPDDITAAVRFLAIENDKLKQRQADRESRRIERDYQREMTRRGQLHSSVIAATPPGLSRRALFIDDLVPQLNHDAGSNALLSHMESLQRLGYEVTFAPSEQFDRRAVDTRSLDRIGARFCAPPVYNSTEEVMRRQAGTFDLVYLHRISSAGKYLALARNYFPKARIVYSVADLHHIRLGRQAVAEDRPELAAWSKRVRLQEMMAAASADAVITHSTVEAEILRKEIRGAAVHVVPWFVPVRPTDVPLAERRGLAFIGGFGHPPNRDAAIWLITEVMPLVRRQDSSIECLLVGSEMPESLAQLCTSGVVGVGHVDTLADIFDRVRLSVAPLAYGAGIKGKVLESMAAGIPCVCTTVAAEGLSLPDILHDCVADSAEALAGIIVRLHDRQDFNSACQTAGLDYVKAQFSDDAVDAAMSRIAVPN